LIPDNNLGSLRVGNELLTFLKNRARCRIPSAGIRLIPPSRVWRFFEATEPGSLETDLFHAMKTRLEGYENRAAIVEFVMRSSGLDSRLVKYDANTREWNRRFNLYNENPSSKRLREVLLSDKRPLEEESAAIVAGVRQVQHIDGRTKRSAHTSNETTPTDGSNSDARTMRAITQTNYSSPMVVRIWRLTR